VVAARFRRVTPEDKIASMRARSELLEALGGEEGCKQLSAAFYTRVGLVRALVRAGAAANAKDRKR
jgi:hypothetical protein